MSKFTGTYAMGSKPRDPFKASDGFVQGSEDGRSVSLNTQIGGGTRDERLIRK